MSTDMSHEIRIGTYSCAERYRYVRQVSFYRGSTGTYGTTQKLAFSAVYTTFSTFCLLEPSTRCLVLVTPVKTHLTDVLFGDMSTGSLLLWAEPHGQWHLSRWHWYILQSLLDLRDETGATCHFSLMDSWTHSRGGRGNGRDSRMFG